MTTPLSTSQELYSMTYADVTFNDSLLDNRTVPSHAGETNDTESWNKYTGGVPMWQVVLFGSLTAVTSVTTVLGNLVVILSFVIERTLRQPTNYFILSLAVSDLLIGLISMPFYTVYLLAGQQWMLGEFMCDLWLSIDYTVCLASIYTVFCITVDRFCSVRIPAKYRDWRTPNKVVAMVAVTWSVPTLVFFTTIFGWKHFVGKRSVPEGSCYVEYLNKFLFSCLLQIGYFWTTLVVMFVLYALIYKVALAMSRKADAKQKQASALVSMAGQTISKLTAVAVRSGAEGGGGKVGQGLAGCVRRGGRIKKRMAIEDKSSCALPSDDYIESDDRSHSGGVVEPPLVIVSPTTSCPRTTVTRVDDHAMLAVTGHTTSVIRSQSSSTLSYTSDSPNKHTHASSNQQPAACTHGHGTEGQASHRQHSTATNGTALHTDSGLRARLAALLNRLPGRGGHVTRSREEKDGYDNKAVQRRAPPCCMLDADDSMHECLAQTLSSGGSPVWRRRLYEQHDTAAHVQHEAHSEVPPQTPRDVFEARRAGRRRTRSVSDNSLCHGHRNRSTDDDIHTNATPTVGESIERKREVEESIQLLAKAPVRDTCGPSTSPTTLPNTTVTAPRTFTSFLPKLAWRWRAGQEAAERRMAGCKVEVRQKSKGEHRALKALRTITIILGAFVLCWTPWHVLSLVTGYLGFEQSPLMVQKLYEIAYWLCYLNSPINPFCYALANQQFKKTFIRIFQLDWHRT